MDESITILDRNFYDMATKTVIKDVYLGDYGIYLGQQSSGLWKDILIPANRHETEQITGLDGLIDYNQTTYAERKLQLPFYCEDITENQLRDIQQILSLQSVYKIILDEKPYRYLWVKTDGQVDMDQIRCNNYSGVFTVSFTAFDPMWQSYYTSLDAATPTDTRSIFNNRGIVEADMPVCSYTATVPSTFTLLNHGNTDAKLIIAMTVNALGNCLLTNTTSGQYSRILTVDAGSFLIDGTRGLVSNAVITNGIVTGETALKTFVFTGDFIVLKPGLNSFTLTNNTYLTKLQFLYRHTYL